MVSSVFTNVNEEISSLSLFERFGYLERLGMLAHETQVGQPERSYAQWTLEEFESALDIFKSWPQFSEAKSAYEKIAQRFSENFSDNAQNREELLIDVARSLTQACKSVLGTDFPDIALNFKTGFGKGTYAGLNPDGEIDVNIDNIGVASVAESSFDGDWSFIELICHEATHLVQRYLSEQSDGMTEDMYLSAMVAEAFYEATDGAKSYNRDLYFYHPFEVEAREVARQVTATLQNRMNAQNDLISHINF